MFPTHRRVTASRSALIGAISVLILNASPAGAQPCPFSLYFGHGQYFGFLTNCVDTYQVSGLAYALGSDATSGTRNIICEAVNEPAPMGSATCPSQTEFYGDGKITIDGNWGAWGVEGMCPNPSLQAGVGRNVFVVIGNNGKGVIISVGVDVLLGQYIAEYAHLAATGAPDYVLPLTCGAPGSSAIRLDGTTQNGGQVTASLTVSPPRIFSDCDADSFGIARGSGSCTEGTFPVVGRGNVYTMSGPCAGSIDLRRTAWSFAAAPASDGTASVQVTRPSDASCIYIGATFTVGGAESPSIGSYVAILGAACTDADGDGVADCQGDCDDTRRTVFPGSPEVCDGLDNNCNGLVDEGLAAVPETCDGIDNDCDGTIDNHGACGVPCNPVQKAGPDLQVTNDPGASEEPVLAWTGSGYGVAWRDTRDDPLQSIREIYFARLSGSGEKIGPDVRVSHVVTDSSDPSIAWTGSEYAIAWEDLVWEEPGPFLQPAVFFARLDALGNRIGNDLRVTTGPGRFPSLVWAGSEYGLAWAGQDGHIFFARLDSSGARIGDEVQVTVSPSGGMRPRLVWTGAEYGLVWQNSHYPYIDILFVRLDSSGNRIGAPTLVSSANADVQFPGPALAWTGSQYGIVWQDFRFVNQEIFFARVSASGTKIGTDIRLTNNPSTSRQPSVAWMGAGYAVVWQDDAPGNDEIFLARLDNAGARIAPDLRLTDDPAYSREPALAWNGSDAAVVWSDTRSEIADVYFARVTCSSLDRDGDGFSSCAECDDTRLDAHPGAVEVCNGLDDDCNGVVDDRDLDGDGYSACTADCNDSDPATNPAAVERCNGVDDNCNGLVDEDAAGADSDGDTVPNACDNCVFISNPDQGNFDADTEGDVCDLDDGLILIMLPDQSSIRWQQEAGFESFNEYRGDLGVLRQTGVYTQDPAKGGLVLRNCDVPATSIANGPDPGVGEAAFYLVTGNHGGVESSLGKDSSGAERPNDHPCP